MEDDERERIICECRENIVNIAREWVKVQKEIESLPKPIITECDIKKRQDIGEKLLAIKNHLEIEVKLLEETEKAPNLIDRWGEHERD
jgi:hypothetical protein